MINCNRRDGSARAVNEVAERLSRRGHDVHVFARTIEDLDCSRLTWRKVPGPSWPDFVDFTTYHLLADFYIKAADFDIVHSVGNNATAANVITIQNIQPAKRQFMSAALSVERTSMLRKLAKWLFLEITTAAEKRVYRVKKTRRLPLYLPVSRGVEAELRAHYTIGNAPVRIIPNAADTAKFRPLTSDERLRWRQTEGFASDDILLAFCGGEWARKGLDLAIRAVALIPDDKVKLFVAGDDPDRDRLKSLARELGVAERVAFGGFRRDMPEALGAADLFLFPSWYEAFSLATIEAAASGLPIVATKINGTEDFIQPGVTGEFVPHDATEIASTLRRLLQQPEKLRSMGAAARHLVERNYTWDRITDMTEEAYRAYLNGA